MSLSEVLPLRGNSITKGDEYDGDKHGTNTMFGIREKKD